MPEIARPALRYHGSKWRIAPWIIQHFPAHECYCEAFGGGAAVLLHNVQGMVLISSYPSELYERLYHDWLVDRIGSRSDCGASKTESLWISPRAAERMRQPSLWQEATR
jgi:hypothetical protein